MNRSDARAIDKGFGWIGEYRLVWKAEYYEVKKIGSDGRRTSSPEVFPSKAEAECAAWRALYETEQPVMVRAGERLSSQMRNAAEALFKPTVAYTGPDDGDGAWLRELIARTKPDQVKE
ncbi:MAG TPA: hypothetical protein VHP34_11220 [Alphaproteobacteria bacterium]|nr:hypothetical protein [Alphaproteobacteria bacterium]